MPKAKQRFTYTRWVKVDEEGNAQEVDVDQDKTTAELAEEGIHPEHVNVEPGDDVDLPKGQQGGLSGFLQDEGATESKPKSVAKPKS